MRNFIKSGFALAIGAMLVLSSCKEDVQVTKAQYKDISESVYASVTVQPMSLYNVFATNTGIIDELYVAEGDSIGKGKVLAEIRAINSELNLENASLRYKLAEDQYKGDVTALEALEDEIALMAIQVRIDSQNYDRQTRLWEQDIGSRSTLEKAELQFKASRKSLRVLQNQYEQNARELRSAYDQARVNKQQAAAALDEFTIVSRFDGCVYELLKEEGERVMLQEPIARVGKCDVFILEMLVDEVDIAQLHVDQLVVIRLDAYTSQVFEARVTKIYPSKNLQTQTFTVEAEFVESPSVLYAGLGGEANIVIDTRKDVLVVPIEYIKDGDRVVTDNGEITIETGLQSLEYVEVVSGIDSSTVLQKPSLQ